MAHIALVTERYPYEGLDSVFLEREVQVLAQNHAITVFPVDRGDERRLDLPGNVACSDALIAPSLRRSPLSLLPEVTARNHRWLGVQSRGRRDLSKVAIQRFRAARATWTQRQFAAWLSLERRIDLVYSWWGSAPTFGVARALEGTGIPLVARVHGYDVFPQQDRLGYVPFQEALLQRVQSVFSASAAGAHHLRCTYPKWANRVHVAYLGVDGPMHLAPAPTGQVVHLVTSSSIVQVKRLDRMVDVVKFLKSKGVKVSWSHLGDGPLLADLKKMSEVISDCVHFIGQIPNHELIAWLTNQEIDLLCNVSDSEGLPVSLMEAAACGIPLLALDVGGNREIVDESVGRLLPRNADTDDIARAIQEIVSLPKEERLHMRRKSRERWAERFQAGTNYAKFSTILEESARGTGPSS